MLPARSPRSAHRLPLLKLAINSRALRFRLAPRVEMTRSLPNHRRQAPGFSTPHQRPIVILRSRSNIKLSASSRLSVADTIVWHSVFGLGRSISAISGASTGATPTSGARWRRGFAREPCSTNTATTFTELAGVALCRFDRDTVGARLRAFEFPFMSDVDLHKNRGTTTFAKVGNRTHFVVASTLAWSRVGVEAF
jgi:hypothetical protein